MSAYVVHPDTINLIATAADRYDATVYCDPADTVRSDPDFCRLSGKTQADTIGRILWDENLYSVGYRYDLPTDRLTDRTPSPKGIDDYRFSRVNLDALTMDPRIVVLGSIRCLRYQSCESPDYRESAGAKVLEAIELAVIHSLTSEAPWGWTRQWSADRTDAIKAKVAASMVSQ